MPSNKSNLKTRLSIFSVQSLQEPVLEFKIVTMDLSRMGSKLEQSAHPMSYSEAKTILRNNFRTEWQQRLDIGTEEDSIHQMDRAAQVTIFRLRTGHCQLLSHLHRLKISHSDECPCGTSPQTPNHILQSCPTFDDSRRQTWPSPVEALQEALGTG